MVKADAILRQALAAYEQEEADLKIRLAEIEQRKQDLCRALELDPKEIQGRPVPTHRMRDRVLSWANSQEDLFGVPHVARAFGKTDAYASLLLSQLARDGDIERLARGVYRRRRD